VKMITIMKLIMLDVQAFRKMMTLNLIMGIGWVNLLALPTEMPAWQFVTTSFLFISITISTHLVTCKKESGELLSYSLPVDRNTIVFARYLTWLFTAAIVTVLWLFLTYLSILLNRRLPFSFDQLLSLKSALIFTAMMVIQSSIFIPAFFRFGIFGTGIGLFGSIAPLFFFITILRDKSSFSITPSVYGNFLFVSLLLLVFLGLLGISCRISLAVNRSREF